MNKEIFACRFKNEGNPENFLNVTNTGLVYATEVNMYGNRPFGRNDYLLIYVHSGKVDITNNKETTVFNKNNIIIYKPYQPQKYTYIACPDSEIYWIHFNGVFAEKILEDLNLNCHYKPIKPNKLIVKLFCDIYQSLIEKKTNYEITCNYLFLMLLSVFSESAQNPSDTKESRKQHQIKQLLTEIDANIKNYHSIDDLASFCSMSNSTFIKLFTSTVGFPPIEYLNTRKLEHSSYLLTETDYSISEIAETCGFQNQFYFSKMFKKKFGVSPLRYRNIHIANQINFNNEE